MSSRPREPLLTLEVERYLSGVRIDTFLHRHLRNYTTWRLSRMVVEGLVLVDGLRAESSQRVARGQTVSIRLIEPPDKLLEAEAIPLNIIYEDPWLLVIDKPAGLVAHPVGAYQAGTLCNAIQSHLDMQTHTRSLLRPGIVHRLDRMTSGLIVITKEHLSHRRLSLDFQRHRTRKTYLALADGDPPFDARTVDAAIGTSIVQGCVLQSTSVDARRPKPARTDLQVVQRRAGHALIECHLHTGRNHQIRVHLAHVGHPVLGDDFYGCDTVRTAGGNDRVTESPRHALHASRLEFEHPVFRTELVFTSVPPTDFWALGELTHSVTLCQQPTSEV